MPNAPTHLTGRPRSERCLPKGPRLVARLLRERLAAAALQLEEVADAHAASAVDLEGAGDADSAAAFRAKESAAADCAAAVRTVLRPGGWTNLRNEPGAGSAASNLALTTNVGLRDALVAAAAEFCESLSSVADDGFRALLEGSWTPPEVVVDRTRDARARKKAPASARTVLNVRVQDDLRASVQDLLPDLSETLGYRVSLSSVTLSWLADELGVERPNTLDGETVRTLLSRPVLEHMTQVVQARGVTFQDVVEGGIRSLLDGTWRPEVPYWVIVENRPRGEAGKWEVDPDYVAQDPVERAMLSVRVDRELLAALRERAEQETNRHGYPFHAGMITGQILKDRLGLPDAE